MFIIPFNNLYHSGGVCDSEGKMIWYRKIGFQGHPVVDISNSDYINKEAIFMGHLTNHYGHFILESLSRFHIFFEKTRVFFKNKELVFIALGPTFPIPSCNLLNYMIYIFNLKNISFRLIHKCTQFKKIYIPECNLSINQWINPLQMKIYNRISSSIPINNQFDKIFISRRTTKKKSIFRIANEDLIEQLFISKGFHIIIPDSQHFIDNVSYYRGANVMAGIEGSGLHNILFMKSDTQLIHINSTRNIRRKEKMSLNQFNCCSLNNIKTKVIEFKGDIEKKEYDIAYLESEMVKLL